MLKLAEGLSLPLKAVTEKMSFLGRTGSGKTYAAMKLAELMLDDDAQIVALDPVGAWSGLRIGGHWNIPIFGGLRGDFPLEPTGGKLMADLITDRAICAVLDVSQFIRAEQVRFASDFVERFFNRKKAAPSAVHLFLEECQEFSPQNPGPNEAHMLHHFERMWKLGRGFGIGGSLISQRPQEVNKKVLNQSGTLFVFQMTGPQERKAISEWTKEHGIDDDIQDLLPRLKVGEPHVWSPTFLQCSKTVRILPKITADVSQTPEVGARRREQPLTPIDVEKLKTEMAATVERSKAEDPKELKRIIADLRKQLKSGVVDTEALSKAEQRGKEIAAREFLEDTRRMQTELAKAKAMLERIHGDSDPEKWLALDQLTKRPVPTPTVKPAQNYSKTITRPKPVRADPSGDLTGPEQRILDAIAWLEGIGVDTPDQTAVAFLAGYTYGGGGYNNPRGALRTKGLLEYVAGDRIRLTEEGRALAAEPETALTTDELHRAVLERLPGPEQKILSVILERYPESLTNEECAEKAGYTVGAGGYNNPRGRLRTLGLIEYPGGGHVRARDILFLDQ